MSDAAARSRRPLDHPFYQQRLKAWQPILTPKWVVLSFAIVGVIFVPVGIGLKAASDSVVEVVVQYDGSSITSGSISGDCTIPSTQPYRNGSCQITITAPSDMNEPIYVYYELENFYQNHRRYVKSVAAGQLDGYFDISTSACDPLYSASEGGVTKNLFPCGLIANSMFNDSIVLVNNSFTLNEKDISWPSDRNDKYANLPAGTYQAHHNSTWFLNDTYPGIIGPELMTNEHFIVWMRTAALPHFRKLYGRINQSLKKGQSLVFSIGSNFPVRSFSGSKALVVSTTSFLGGKNPFLGIAYIVVGSVCLFLALLFAVKQKFGGRTLGDPRGLVWATPKH